MITIGLIDDDPMVRTGLRLILGGDPELSIVGEAADGEAGLRMIDDAEPELILLDIRMPRMDGLAVLRQLAGRPSAPMVIVLTTFDTDNDVLQALGSGAQGFLLKDADPPEMIAAIRAVHRGDPALSPSVASQVIAAATRGQNVDPRLARSVESLTEREREVAIALAEGLTNSEIARKLYLSVATVKANVARIFTKLEVDNRVSAAMIIRDAGLAE